MKDKEWYKSKTIWAGVIIVAYGIATAAGITLPTELIITLASGLGIVGIRQAIGNNKF